MDAKVNPVYENEVLRGRLAEKDREIEVLRKELTIATRIVLRVAPDAIKAFEADLAALTSATVENATGGNSDAPSTGRKW